MTQAMALTTPFNARAVVGRPRSILAAARDAIWMRILKSKREGYSTSRKKYRQDPERSFFLSRTLAGPEIPWMPWIGLQRTGTGTRWARGGEPRVQDRWS